MLKSSLPKGQTMLEYLLVTTLIAFLVFFALMGKNSMMMDLFHEVNFYYDAGGKALAGGCFLAPTSLTDKNHQGTLVVRTPQAIVGGWCPWGACIEGYQERECACPRPAFGGAICSGSPTQSCSGGTLN
ncbi:MAG: hypothetical protein HGA80_03165 [Candidatus Omnitrophica bacterium]|nr:hypothetical protein [Candidatus Omnitrophota bacterium]